jgi:MoxR-like ATPase
VARRITRRFFLKDRYGERKGQQWPTLKESAEQTTSVLREVVKSLVRERTRIDDHALTTLFQLCQNSNDGPSVAEKKQRVRELDLPRDDTDRILALIDDSIGSVGAAVQKITLHVGEKEEDSPDAERTLHQCFERLITSNQDTAEDELVAAVSDLIEIDFYYVQSGRMSPIIHYLAPETFPVINGRSIEAMDYAFDEQVSDDLEAYLDEREVFLEVQDEFEFRSHFRDLDWFCNWVLQDDNPWTRGDQLNESRQYWQTQPGTNDNNHPEVLWPIWKQENVISTGFDSGPVAELGDLDTQPNNFIREMSPGDIVIAKGGHHLLLGLGVVSPDGVEYRANEETTITFTNEGVEKSHADVRYVDWVWTVTVDEAVDTTDWEIENQFSNSTVVGYKNFYELRYKLVQAVGKGVLPDLERLEKQSAAYLPENDPEPRDVPAVDDSPGKLDSASSYYWVNQNNPEEIENEYLDASVDNIWHHDLTVLDTGDIVFHYFNQQLIGYSTVVDEASIVEIDGNEQYRVDVDLTRFDTPKPIEDVREYLDRDDVRRDKYYPINKNAEVQENYLSQLTDKAGEYLLEDSTDPPHGVETLRTKLEPIDVSFDMPEELFFEDRSKLRNEIEASLNSGKHIIFTGPPGTGKTKLAKEICQQCQDNLPQVDDYTFTTATSEWTAFDTIGGYMPTRDANSAGSDLEFSPRLFLNCFRRDQDGIVNDWLVIDEINRSDIDKAFGQLFSVLSGDSVDLPYERGNQVEIASVDSDATDETLETISGDPDIFPVTPSWRLLATMNTYDKASLYEMSYAFMRRFNFIHVGIPELNKDDGTIRTSLLDPNDQGNYAEAWIADDETLETTISDIYKHLTVIWKVVNDYPRSIGPSIVRDILDFVDAYDLATPSSQRSEALTAAIVGMIYPQLEGMRPETQRNLVQAFSDSTYPTEHGNVKLDVNESRLKAKAEDFFNIRFENE